MGETASKLSHPNILKVLHVFRYQETEKIGNHRSLENWTIIVMERHLKNIGELELDERTDLPYLLQDTLGQVLNKIADYCTNPSFEFRNLKIIRDF